MKMLMKDPRYSKDMLKLSFPATSQLLDTHINEAFFKIVMGIQHRIHKSNEELPKEQQPHIIRGKTSVVPDAADRAERAAMTQVRGGMRDPRRGHASTSSRNCDATHPRRRQHGADVP